jgi:hypothetical protein
LCGAVIGKYLGQRTGRFAGFGLARMRRSIARWTYVIRVDMVSQQYRDPFDGKKDGRRIRQHSVHVRNGELKSFVMRY